MGDYISREAAIIGLAASSLTPHQIDDAAEALQLVPAADVVEVRHAKWHVTDAYPHNVYCSACYKIFAQEHWEIWKDGSLPRD